MAKFKFLVAYSEVHTWNTVVEVEASDEDVARDIVDGAITDNVIEFGMKEPETIEESDRDIWLASEAMRDHETAVPEYRLYEDEDGEIHNQ